MRNSTIAAVNNDMLITYRMATLTLLACAIYATLTTMAWAGSPMGDVLCDVVEMITQGNLGRALATLGIIIVGVGASIGKVSWGLAMTVAVGIAVTIRAPVVLNSLLGVGTSC